LGPATRWGKSSDETQVTLPVVSKLALREGGGEPPLESLHSNGEDKGWFAQPSPS